MSYYIINLITTAGCEFLACNLKDGFCSVTYKIILFLMPLRTA